jgi:hypothetical protein
MLCRGLACIKAEGFSLHVEDRDAHGLKKWEEKVKGAAVTIAVRQEP